MKIMMMVEAIVMIKCSKLGKEEREKQNLSSAANAVQAKAIADIPVVCDFPDVFLMICPDYP